MQKLRLTLLALFTCSLLYALAQQDNTAKMPGKTEPAIAKPVTAKPGNVTKEPKTIDMRINPAIFKADKPAKK